MTVEGIITTRHFGMERWNDFEFECVVAGV